MDVETRTRNRARQLLRLLLFVAALGFFGYYVLRNWAEVKSTAVKTDPLLLLVALVLVTASLLTKALMNVLLLRRLLHTPMGSLCILHSYTKAQMVKYIPGRIWGILFQASALQNNVRKTDVWVVSVLEAMIIYSFSLLLLMGTVVFIDTIPSGVKSAVIGGGISVIAIVYFNFGRVLRFAGFSEKTLKQYAALIDDTLVAQIALLVVADWILYIGMWAVMTHGQLTIFESFVTAVNYATASIVGWLVFVLPNGLVVREALFVAFGKIIGDNMALLVMYSIIVRLLLLMGDLLLYVFTAVLTSINEQTERTLG